MSLTENFAQDANGNIGVQGTVTANAGTGTFAISAASLPLPTGASTSAKQPALGVAGTPSTDVITVQGETGMTPLQVIANSTSASAITAVVASITSVTLLAANANRKGFLLYNGSNHTVNVAFAATASAASYTITMQMASLYEASINYTGAVSAIWPSASTGNMLVTELT